MLYKYFKTVNDDDDTLFEMLLNSDGIVFNNSPLSGQKTKHDSLVYNMSSHLWKYCDTVDWLSTKQIC